jgi:hypothetical protein
LALVQITVKPISQTCCHPDAKSEQNRKARKQSNLKAVNNKNLLGTGVAIAMAMAVWLPTTATAVDEPMKPMKGDEHQTKAGSAQMESGPATIDVSAYPKAGQDIYPLFTEKCAQCHHLNHTINSDHHALPDEWESIVNRMRRKPGSNINKTEAEQIVEFLTYDSSVRKKTVVDEMLAMATPEEKKAAEDKIKEVHAKYDQQ